MRYLLTALLLISIATMTTAQDPPAEGETIPTTDAELTRMKLGEFWYGMYTPDGNTEGYARIVLRETEQGGVHCDWELHIAGEGWKYEEERQVTFDADWKLTWTEMRTGGNRVAAAREGKVMVGKSGVDDLRAEVSDDAITGMGFVLAAAMKLKQGTSLKRTEYDEANDLKNLETTSFNVGKKETIKLPGGDVEAWRIDMQRSEKGKALPIWVNEDREIVQIDWGTDNLMKLHREETSELFKPAPPTLTQLEPDDKTKLVLTADFIGFELEEMWNLWATAEGLSKWWPQEAEVGDKVGGPYKPAWKNEEGEIVWQLLGEIEIWEPNQKLGFSWKWNTDPADAPTLHVVVDFEEVEGGVKLTITHTEFDPVNDDQRNRASLHQGWEQFCTKLAALKK